VHEVYSISSGGKVIFSAKPLDPYLLTYLPSQFVFKDDDVSRRKPS
jgi:hypothetical protein